MNNVQILTVECVRCGKKIKPHFPHPSSMHLSCPSCKMSFSFDKEMYLNSLLRKENDLHKRYNEALLSNMAIEERYLTAVAGLKEIRAHAVLGQLNDTPNLANELCSLLDEVLKILGEK